MTLEHVICQPLSGNPAIEHDLLKLLHPSLKQQLQVINFAQITPEQAKLVFSDDCESVVRDLVRELRVKRLLP